MWPHTHRGWGWRQAYRTWFFHGWTFPARGPVTGRRGSWRGNSRKQSGTLIMDLRDVSILSATAKTTPICVCVSSSYSKLKITSIYREHFKPNPIEDIFQIVGTDNLWMSLMRLIYQPFKLGIHCANLEMMLNSTSHCTLLLYFCQRTKEVIKVCLLTVLTRDFLLKVCCQ